MEARAAVDDRIAPSGIRILPRLMVLLFGLVLVAWVVPDTVILISAGLAVYALLGPRQTLEALFLTALLILMSFGDINMGRWLVLFAAFVRTVWDAGVARQSAPPLFRSILIFVLAILVLSAIGSYYPLISILKAVSWGMGVLSMIAAFHRTDHLRDYWLSWFLTLGLFILYASLPLYFSSLGYRRNGVGFQGILSHPQTFGPILAPIAALLTGLVLFHGARSRVLLGGIVLAWFSIYASQARTGLLAVVLAFIAVVVISMVRGGPWRSAITLRLGRFTTVLALLVLCVFSLLYWTAIEQSVTGFLVKDYRIEDGATEASMAEALEGSRSQLIAKSMSNFRKAPLTGIGLGVPSDVASGLRVETGLLGLPQGASVEKGFMASAILEESGLIGAFLFLFILIGLIRSALFTRSPLLFWIVLTSLLVNLGEAILLSIGGNGFFHWLLLTFCYAYARSARGQPLDTLTRTLIGNENNDQRRLRSYGRSSDVPPEYSTLAPTGGARL